MTEFDRKMEEASARINRSVANFATTLEKETAETGQISERRSCTCGAHPFLESTARGSGETRPVRGFPRKAAQARHAERRDATETTLNRFLRRSACRPLLFSLLGTVLLAGCGHKQTQVAVPPPPSLPQVTPARRRRLRILASSQAERSRSQTTPSLSSSRPVSRVGTALLITIGAVPMVRFTT